MPASFQGEWRNSYVPHSYHVHTLIAATPLTGRRHQIRCHLAHAGHAVLGLKVPGLDPVHKVTIVPRGRALGITASLPEEDRHSYTKDWMQGQLAMLFGGRVAEELIFGEQDVTTGAGNDIERATTMARRMVTTFGMSDVIGLVAVADSEQEVFLGREIMQRRPVSEHTARIVDQEVKRIIDEAHQRAHAVLGENRDLLESIAQALLERETRTRVLDLAPAPWIVRECLDSGMVYLENPPVYERLASEFAWEQTWQQESQRRAKAEPTRYAVSALLKRLRSRGLKRHKVADMTAALVQRTDTHPVRVVDLGCGAGQLLGIVLERLPPAWRSRLEPSGGVYAVPDLDELTREIGAALGTGDVRP